MSFAPGYSGYLDQRSVPVEESLLTFFRENLTFKHFEAKPPMVRYYEMSTWSFKLCSDWKRTPEITLNLPRSLSSLC